MITTESVRNSAMAALNYDLEYSALLKKALLGRQEKKQDVFISTMCDLAFNCEAFVFDNDGKFPFSAENNNKIALIYSEGRKGKFKRVLREVKGQLMEITDRRKQYYAKRQAYDERWNQLVSAAKAEMISIING